MVATITSFRSAALPREPVQLPRGIPAVVQMPLGPLRPPEQGRISLCQRAYVQIRDSLISSTFRPGHKLILRPLAAGLGLSPTPVREALLRLVSEQALVLDERGSAVVPVMTRTGFRELIEMRSDLEARAAARAISTCTEQQIDELERINERYLTLLLAGDPTQAFDVDSQFHRAICRAGQSPLILRMLEGLWMRLGPVYALGLEQPPAALPPGDHPHVLMITALRRRNVDEIRAAALADVAYGNDLIEPRLAEG